MSLPKYRPDIDGLRAIAVLAVVLHHLSSHLLPGGYIGVDIFFVISGYLITSIISREIEEGTFTYAAFYERRARRIFPALFAMLFVVALAGYFLLLPSDLSSTMNAVIGTAFFSSNLVFWREMKQGYFAATDVGLNPLLHTWSLAVEEQFYLFFPVLLYLCAKYCRKHTKVILVVCTIFSLAVAIVLIKSKSVAVFFLSPFRAWELLVGSLLAMKSVPLLSGRAVREASAAIGLVAIFAACFAYDTRTVFPGLAAVVPVLGAALLIHAGSSGGGVITRLLSLKPMVFVGLISYSLYLWHWPLIVLFRYAIGGSSVVEFIPALFVASIALGFLSYKYIERPFRSKDGYFNRRFVFASSGVVVLALCLFAGFGLFRHGFTDRFSSEVVTLDQARQPQIPFRNCDARAVNSWCQLGKAGIKPTIFLWGDSHLLSWAPAFQDIFERQGVSAVFATRSACPPLLGVVSQTRPACSLQNGLIGEYLYGNPEIKTVVMAGFWSFYFNTPKELTSVDSTVAGSDVASAALRSTLGWLRENKKQVVLVGPVPVFDRSVPMALALEKATGKHFLQSTLEQQRELHTRYFDAVSSIDPSTGVALLDPIDWLCTPICKAQTEGGAPIYRDAHHLSVFGAQVLEQKLSEGILATHFAAGFDSVNAAVTP